MFDRCREYFSDFSAAGKPDFFKKTAQREDYSLVVQTLGFIYSMDVLHYINTSSSTYIYSWYLY